MVRVMTTAARREAKKDRFDLWLDKWAARHESTTREAIAPAFGLASVVLGRPLDPSAFAGDLVARQRTRLLDLAKMIAPDELPDAVDRACDGFEADADGLLSSLLAPSP
jgi:hypothetical protein